MTIDKSPTCVLLFRVLFSYGDGGVELFWTKATLLLLLVFVRYNLHAPSCKHSNRGVWWSRGCDCQIPTAKDCIDTEPECISETCFSVDKALKMSQLNWTTKKWTFCIVYNFIETHFQSDQNPRNKILKQGSYFLQKVSQTFTTTKQNPIN